MVENPKRHGVDGSHAALAAVEFHEVVKKLGRSLRAVRTWSRDKFKAQMLAVYGVSE